MGGIFVKNTLIRLSKDHKGPSKQKKPNWTDKKNHLPTEQIQSEVFVMGSSS